MNDQASAVRDSLKNSIQRTAKVLKALLTTDDIEVIRCTMESLIEELEDMDRKLK